MQEEDYLWNKTGEDAEIERLENALRAFRYAEDAPPALPSKIIPFEAKAPRRFFRLSFAFAGCAALLFVAFGVWLKISNDKTEIAKDSTEKAAPQTSAKISAAGEVKKQNDFIVERAAAPKQIVERNIVKIRKTVSPIARLNKTTAQNADVAKSNVKLTKEEKYAYEQLMLALSITSSELKRVKDKAESVEEKTDASLNER